jgi:hypothetical protein
VLVTAVTSGVEADRLLTALGSAMASRGVTVRRLNVERMELVHDSDAADLMQTARRELQEIDPAWPLHLQLGE